ncbi:MAG: hypothetical protein ACKPKO_51050, partial [Candidatus Fonsibacter sp.]
TKLRACILLLEVKTALAPSTGRRPVEALLSPPTKMAKIEEEDAEMKAASGLSAPEEDVDSKGCES